MKITHHSTFVVQVYLIAASVVLGLYLMLFIGSNSTCSECISQCPVTWTKSYCHPSVGYKEYLTIRK